MGRRAELVGQMEMFTPVEVPPKKRTIARKADPTWTRYDHKKAKKPYACDFCRLNQRDDPFAPVARLARYRRRNGTTDMYLCTSHANDQRIVDGLPKFKSR